MVYVHKYEFLAGLRYINQLTNKPVGMNVIVEKSSKIYEQRMKTWVDMALEEGIKFFVTSLGNPEWVVEKAARVKGHVYHDITSRKWALKAESKGVSGLICVNNRAGGHAGDATLKQLFEDTKDLGLPLVAAGGIASQSEVEEAIKVGYQGVQLGTRFIATDECSAHADYKRAIIAAKEKDIVLTEKISGVPVSVIRTPFIEKMGTKASPLTRYLLKGRKTKHYVRLFYSLKSLFQLKKASIKGSSYKDYFQAGKGVGKIDNVKKVVEVIRDLTKGL